MLNTRWRIAPHTRITPPSLYPRFAYIPSLGATLSNSLLSSRRTTARMRDRINKRRNHPASASSFAYRASTSSRSRAAYAVAIRSLPSTTIRLSFDLSIALDPKASPHSTSTYVRKSSIKSASSTVPVHPPSATSPATCRLPGDRLATHLGGA